VEAKVTGDVMDFGVAKSAFLVAKSALLKDPEGNVFALNEFTG